MPEGKWISYLRVSTQRQGKSGLGLEAQRNAVTEYLNGGQWSLVKEYVEIESGKRSDRPELEKALAACKKHKAKLVIAKLDRLSRNLDHRFRESCHKRGFICRFRLLYVRGALRTKDGRLWQRGGGRLSCRSEMQMWRG